MTKTQKVKKSSQSEAFIKKARELGCDESEAAFEEKLGRSAKATTKPQNPSKK